MSQLAAIDRYLRRNRQRFVRDWMSSLRIPSVSTEPRHRKDMASCARHFARELRRIGMTKAEVLATGGHPVVYAEWLGARGKPTALVYGHYDVQPAEPLAEWKSPPFRPAERGGRVFARGAVDDKGQVYMHLKALEAHFRVAGGPPLNVKVVLEGEEEIGSPNFIPWVKRNARRLRADVLVASDTAMANARTPALVYGLRGILYTQIDLRSAKSDLHSGHFGGAVPNAGEALARLLAGLKDGQGRITVPGFYERVRDLTAEERENLARIPFDEAKFLAEAGVGVEVSRRVGEAGHSTLERIWSRPTLDVNGLWGGYTEDGKKKTVIPAEAHAKVSMRLVPDQDPDELFDRFARHVRDLAPPGCTVDVRYLQGAPAFLVEPDHPCVRAARRALERTWKNPAVLTREGGSIPIMNTFREVLGVPCILMGFGLDDDQVHAPNEKFNLSSFHGGTRSAAYLYDELSRV
jgi:acetylornithine deacetylase/succinyl-diaminopimelate desuccinylase-like protein